MHFLRRKTLVAAVVSLWTGIPAAKMMEEEAQKLLHMEDRLRQRRRSLEAATLAEMDALWEEAKALEARAAAGDAAEDSTGTF